MGGWKSWIGKRIFVILKNKRNYSGTITDVIDKPDGTSFITILDKYQRRVTFLDSEINTIQEEGGV